ncbi:oxidoreductase [Halogeometricum pallidum JCM 14848]|uniref:Oxidoreductase n=1 Tax=Halogeometricum pallidum JCM 14848 TaxID=1227487 RepID=M0D825_HALPD|nr:Gfo/Idh/MocA family oxidoreductase [Halogeometricum pallidum]ELZ31621.1 oxidoreductase [Halogeometricum pallidum JCM 14848]
MTGIDVGVIGVGSMGQNHARIYSEMWEANLVGVADADVERAGEIASDLGTEAFTTEELLSRVDAVSIVVPTRFHASVAEQCIDAGVNILVEKPFVTSQEEGRKLIERANEAGVKVQVGHVEQFNPAVTELARITEDFDPIAIHARRLGPPSDDARSLDGVVHDLMIHDIDVVRSLIPGRAVRVNAMGTSDRQYTNAQLSFDNGTIVNLTASRVTQQKTRDLTITAEDSYITLDYIDQSVEIHRQSRPEYMNDDGNLRYRHEGIIEKPFVNTGEPLRLELESFVDCIIEDETPLVTAEDGLRAVELADHIRDCAEDPEHGIDVDDRQMPHGMN